MHEAYPPETHHLVERTEAVRTQVKARKDLEKRDGQIRRAEWQAQSTVLDLWGKVEQIQEKNWFSRVWHRKELKHLRNELEQSKQEARTLAQERKALTRELKAAARLEKEARQAAKPGAELAAQQQRERYTALEAVYKQRLERERPQQKRQPEQEQGMSL